MEREASEKRVLRQEKDQILQRRWDYKGVVLGVMEAWMWEREVAPQLFPVIF